MEHLTTPRVLEESSKRSPWGTIIGIILILAVVVGAAYYAFSTRTAPHSTSSTVR